jgi:hypothetical protein
MDSIAVGFDRFATASLWQVVMLVTCVECYLKDILATAAKVDSQLMSRSEQVVRCADVFAAISLEALADNIRARWARGWVDEGGPPLWISKLDKIGAKNYPENLAPRLDVIWGIRHVVVHSAGFATADFVARHSSAFGKSGERVRVTTSDFGGFASAVFQFAELTDAYFVARCSALADAPGESQVAEGKKRT